jgi:redox-sensitive bicupin YhaK (pirin superfamily)
VTTRIFQIWIIPDVRGATPNWGAKAFPKASREGGFEVLASGRPADAGTGALPINADAAVMATTLQAGQSAELALAPGRVAYLVPAKGAITVNGVAASTRDGIAVRDEERVTVTATEEAEVVVVEAAA